MWQAIILSVNQCPKQRVWQIQTCRFWQALKVAVSYLDSPEGLPAKEAAFLSGLPTRISSLPRGTLNAPELRH